MNIRLVLALGLCLSAPLLAAAQQPNSEQQCAQLQDLAVPAKDIGLPTNGATIKSAKLVAAAPEQYKQPSQQNPSGVVLATPEYCQVMGEIAPIDPSAPAIQFEVNLPTDWNGNALHMGGGGYDGTVQNGAGPLPTRYPDTEPYPIARGYATFGSDGGHKGNNASFALNQEALINFAYAQLKKTHDVALQIIKRRYGRSPVRTYFAGQSEGGREGLTVAQRFPQDYDGVVVTAPAINYVSWVMRFNDIASVVARPGGFLTPAKIKAFAGAVLAQCDMDDGVADGIVGNYLGCHFDPSVLRCPNGADTGDSCLSDAQLKTIAAIYRPRSWKSSTGKVILSYPRYFVGGTEAQPTDMATWIFGKAPWPHPQPAGILDRERLGLSIGAFYGNSGVRYLIVRDPAFQTSDFNPAPYATQLVKVANLLKSTDPNLRAFQKRGGKLIVVHNTADLTISPLATIDYYQSVVKLLGQDTVNKFVRLYIVPGGDHGGAGAPTKVDLLGMLDRWVTDGSAPGNDAVAAQYGPNGNAIRSKPLCEYPYYPRYSGSGEPSSAGSYRCTISR